MSENEVVDLLRQLAAANAAAQAPPRVEAAVMAAWDRLQPVQDRRNRLSHGPFFRWRFWAAAALATVVALLVVRTPTPRAPEPYEVATGYFALTPDFNPAAAEYAPTVRVSVPRTMLAQFGLPVDSNRIAEPVQADLALGSDGVARAIRFVRTVQTN